MRIIRTALSLLTIALAACVFSLAVIAGAHEAVLAHTAQDDLLITALALCGVVISSVNGFGRKTARSHTERFIFRRTAVASKGPKFN